MNGNQLFLTFLILLLATSCSRRNAGSHVWQFVLPEVAPAIGRQVPDSNRQPAIIVKAGKPAIIAAGKPVTVYNSTNVHSAANPEQKQVYFTAPKRREHLKPPVVKLAIDHPIVVGVPQVILAKDASFKDNDPANFSSFKSLQGLLQPLIECIMQDRDGNLWFGTFSGGISKFDGKYFTNYTVAQGLSNDGVWTLIQDHLGNIWMGTLGGGVIKYDGRHLSNYKTAEGLCDEDIYCLYEDHKNNIWIASKNGVSCFDGKRFTNYFTEQGLPNNVVHCVAEDRDGKIWFGTDKGIAVLSNDSFMTCSETGELSNHPITAILFDKENTVWLGTDDALIKLDENRCTTYKTGAGLSSRNIRHLCKDKDDNLWIAGFGSGIEKFDGKQFTHYTSNEGLSNDQANCVFEDRSGTLWVGTNGGGACRYDGNFFTHLTTMQGLAHNAVKGIVEDRNNNFWFATWGGGASEFDGKKFQNYSPAQGLKSNNLFSVLADSKGNLWFGADNGISMFDGKTFQNFDTSQGFTSSPVWSICEDHRHNIWFGSFGDGVYKYDGTYFTHFSEKQGLANLIVMCVLEDHDGNIWFGTYGDGVYKTDGKTLINFNHTGGLSSDEVMDMYEDKEGNIWIGTIGGGVNKYDGKTFSHYSTAQGLSNDIVMGILQDHSGNMWFSTRNGLNRMLKTSVDTSQRLLKPLFKSYLFEDGLLGVNAYVNALFEDEKGKIWIGTGDRLTVCTPDKEIPDTIAPTMQLAGLSLYNEKVNWQNLQNNIDTAFILSNGVNIENLRFDSLSNWYNVPQHLSLAHDNNYLVFNYIGISMRSPYNIKYQYKLEGMDENWNALTDRTEAAYGNIPFGRYNFKVKAMNSEGYWSKELSYPFEIRAAWWQTLAFKLLLVVIIAVIVYSAYRFRLEQALRLQRIRNKIASDLHDDIGSTINSISVYSEVAKQKSPLAVTELEHIGEASRKIVDAMSDIVWTINPTNDSFESIILRMRSLTYNLMKAKDIEHTFRADDSLNNLKLTMEVRRNFFLVFKEAINNLVKHSEATKASILLAHQDGFVKLQVRDNGKGFDVKKYSTGNGLLNMKNRADEMNATLKIESVPRVGSNMELIMRI
jgi:ligand-binding sensor domain-containing protein/signal transduction histidine kinase